MIATGITVLIVALGVVAFKKGIYSLWDANVHRIDSTEASELLKEKKPFIIDARTPEEYNVSHIDGAVRFEESLIGNIPNDRPILIYCTLGVRSNRTAKELSDLGFKEIYDMKDGILGWANGELPVVNTENEPTENIHTYNKSFAPLLKRGKAVY
ncbi:rhodanese-like domain-containing protein [Roseivirga sp.]|uniref:rhodanese-like domain-containing protein n=1 Tax=Roseivirga sp. TaxID=1964215 RepID=UPI003B5232EA